MSFAATLSPRALCYRVAVHHTLCIGAAVSEGQTEHHGCVAEWNRAVFVT